MILRIMSYFYFEKKKKEKSLNLLYPLPCVDELVKQADQPSYNTAYSLFIARGCSHRLHLSTASHFSLFKSGQLFQVFVAFLHLFFSTSLSAVVHCCS